MHIDCTCPQQAQSTHVSFNLLRSVRQVFIGCAVGGGGKHQYADCKPAAQQAQSAGQDAAIAVKQA